jgi:hypothetical protein
VPLSVDHDLCVETVVEISALRQMLFKVHLDLLVTLARIDRIPPKEPGGIGIHHKTRKTKGIQKDRVCGFLSDALRSEQFGSDFTDSQSIIFNY